MDESILTSIKQDLGVTEDCTVFDGQITRAINTAFNLLWRNAAAGPKGGFRITDKTDMWSDFSDNEILLEDVKTYIYIEAKLIFDPPSSGIVTDSMKEMAKELAFTINGTAECELKQNEGGETDAG